MKQVVMLRTMPPWWSEESLLFRATEHRGLTAREIDTIATWVEEGALPGDPRDAPPRFYVNWAEQSGPSEPEGSTATFLTPSGVWLRRRNMQTKEREHLTHREWREILRRRAWDAKIALDQAVEARRKAVAKYRADEAVTLEEWMDLRQALGTELKTRQKYRNALVDYNSRRA
jgi:hypothetical protein